MEMIRLSLAAVCFLFAPTTGSWLRAEADLLPDGKPLPPAAPEEKAEVFPVADEIASLTAEPASVTLKSGVDYAQVLVTATLKDGTRADVTRMAQIEAPGAIVKANSWGLVTPSGDGEGALTVRVGSQTVSVPVAVTGVGPAAGGGAPGARTGWPLDYIRDIQPVLSKLGCNQGTCHGSKEGKNGFKLSLRGYDSLFDVRALADDLAGRRVNVAFPDSSVMLLKPTNAVPHEGGQVMTEGSKYYAMLRQWISGGAKVDFKSPKVSAIAIFPPTPVIEKIGARQQMRIVATFADGTSRDVTSEAFIETGNGEVAKTDRRGMVLTLRRGEAPILARYEGAYAATTITVMGDRAGFTWVDPPANNEIDRIVAAKLQRTKTSVAPVCSDLEFIRRVYLDLTGLPPMPDEIRSFLADPRDSRWKRDLLIDSLIGSPAYIEHWTNKWADLLQVNSKFLGREGAEKFRAWIRDQVARNVPYDEMARAILTATGSNNEHPAASYFKILRTPEDTMENSTHLWLATRFNCNKCHDHPFERWTQDQYYQMTAYFARVGLDRDPASGDRNLGGTAVEGARPLYEFVVDRPEGETKHERTGKVVQPVFPFKASFKVPENATRRQSLAAWITAADNPYFARSYVNRIWGYLLGTGIIEPLDDIRAGNPPSNPELLDWLARQFVDSGFDTRHVVRLICRSRTYQLSVQSDRWNEDDQINFSHASARRLPAEVLFDAIYAATGAKSAFPGMPAGTRAASLPDSEIKTADGFLGNLGRPARESACECERSEELQLGPVMALISGPTVGDAINAPDNAIATLARNAKDDREWISELFLRFLGRPAAEEEVQAALGVLNSIESQHTELLAATAKYEEESKPAREKAAADREAGIAAIKAEKTALENELAPRLAAAEKERQDKIAAAQAALAEAERALPDKIAAWEKDQKGKTGWSVLDPVGFDSTYNKTKFQKLDDRSVLVTGPASKEAYSIVTETTLTALSGLRLEALTDDRIPAKGPGRSGGGNFVLSEIEATWTPAVGADWKLLREWTFDFSADDWKAEETCTVGSESGALAVTIKPNTDKSGITAAVTAPAGSYVAEIRLKADSKLNQRLYWTTQKDFTTADLRSVPIKAPPGADSMTTVRVPFSADSELVSLRLQTDTANVTYALDSIRLFAGKPVAPQPIKFVDALATFSQDGYDVKSAFDGMAGAEPNGWAIYPGGVGKSQTAAFVCARDNQPIALGPAGGILKITLNQQYPDGKHSLGRFRLSATSELPPLNFGLPKEIVDTLAVAADQRTEAQQKSIREYVRREDSDIMARERALAEASKPLPPDPKLEEVKGRLARAEQPLPPDPRLELLRHDVALSTEQLTNKRLIAAQDLAWALINNPAFLFNR